MKRIHQRIINFLYLPANERSGYTVRIASLVVEESTSREMGPLHCSRTVLALTRPTSDVVSKEKYTTMSK